MYVGLSQTMKVLITIHEMIDTDVTFKHIKSHSKKQMIDQ